MSFYSVFKNSLRVSCYGFCLMTLVYSLIMLLQYQTQANMSVITVLLFYPLVFILVLTNELLKGSQLNEGLKALVRYFALLLAVGLCICLPNSASLTGRVAVVLFVIITLLYVVGALIYAKYAADARKRSEKKTAYKSVYREENRK